MMVDNKNFGEMVYDALATDKDLTNKDVRIFRAKKLLKSMKIEEVIKAEDNNGVEKGSLDFCYQMAKIVNGEVNGDITQIELKRLEDVYFWSRPNSKLTDDQKKQVLNWCERDGHDELVDNIKQKMEGNEDD